MSPTIYLADRAQLAPRPLLAFPPPSSVTTPMQTAPYSPAPARRPSTPEPQPQPQRTFVARLRGTAAAVALLAGGASMLLLVPAHMAAAQARTAPRSSIDTTIAVGAGALVDLSLVSGEVKVTGSSRSTVHLRALSERGQLRLESSASRVTLDVDESEWRRRDRNDRGDRRRRGAGDAETRYDVEVPVGTRVLVRTTSGNVTVTAVRGEVEAHSVSGDVVVADAARRVKLESVSGTVRAERVEGEVRATSVSGDVVLRDVRGAVDVESVSGDIELEAVRSASVQAETVSGDVTYDGAFDAAGRYDFHSHSGDVEVVIPEGTNAAVEVETFSGELESDFPLTMRAGAGDAGPGRRIAFTLGSGGPRVSAVTFSGDVTLTRVRNAGAPPPDRR